VGTYVRRVQTVLTEAELRELVTLSEKKGKTISVLIREAVEETYFKRAAAKRRQAALKSLLALEAPVSDWALIEREIVQGANEG